MLMKMLFQATQSAFDELRALLNPSAPAIPVVDGDVPMDD